jgi:hypothetical protein
MLRKFIKISSDGKQIWAVADDGTAWVKSWFDEPWKPIEPLPDRPRTADEERDR